MKNMQADILQLAARQIEPQDGDYIQDGLIYCGKCHTKKQTNIILFDTPRTVACLCKCQSEALKERDEQDRKRAEFEKISRLRTAGLQDRSYKNWTFEVAEDTAEIKRAKSYCEKWEEMHRKNIGILFWGDVGRGKSFVAACIANKLIGRGVPVLMTNFIKLSAGMQSGFKQDSNEYIAALDRYELLIIDDLGAERATSTAQECVFNIIDSRYRAGKPLIITTNLTLSQMKNPPDISCARIYDRIMQMTVPIMFGGENKRIKAAELKMASLQRC